MAMLLRKEFVTGVRTTLPSGVQARLHLKTRKSIRLGEPATPFPGTSLVASEIAQQSALWPTTLSLLNQFVSGSRLKLTSAVLTGAGTSAYAASAVADAWPAGRAIPTTDLLLMTKEELEQAEPGFATTELMISLARSGDSPESVAVVERMKHFFPSVEHLAIVCNAEGRLAHLPGVRVIALHPGTNDRSLAMTSSFSNLALGGLCLKHGKSISVKLADICKRVSENLERMNDIARQVAAFSTDRVVVLSSTMHALTREGSLKIMELSAGRILAMPESFLGVRHGPLSFVRENTPIVCFTSSDTHKQSYERDVIQALKSQGLGRIVVVGETPAGWQYDWFVPASAFDLPDALRTPFEIPFMQLLAYQLSLHAGIDPDNPSPGGIVTRVVKPFEIHDDFTGR